MNKTAIKNFAIWARETLMSEIRLKANGLGIHGDKVATKLDSSTKDVHFFDIGTGTVVELSGDTLRHRNQLANHIEEKAKQSDYPTAYESVMEEVAYTWFNRLVAIRFMEVNDYLPSKIRVLSSETGGKQEPDLVTTPFDAEFDWTESEKAEVRQLQNSGGQDPLFRYLFRKQCAELNKILPKLFEPTTKYTDLLLNFSYISKDSVIYHLVNDIPEEDFREAVEIVGWLYQYYNTEPKEKVFADLKKNIKITKENIPAATQLFTPDWIVKYMVENSLGRLWLDKNPNENLQTQWKYYLEEAEQTPEVQSILESKRSETSVNLEETKFLDPCMGSGHILVYAFDVFMDIYRVQGYSDRDSAQNILRLNLYGLDIDKRAYQLSYFALMMKARSYDRRFLSRGISPNVFCPCGDRDLENFGSLYRVIQLEEEPTPDAELTMFDKPYEVQLQNWSFKYVLSQKYDVVCTNPPYMGGGNGNAKLVEYMKTNYPDSKSDLFAVFIERSLFLTKELGFTAMITQHSFMFLSSYEKLRTKLLLKDFINMTHLGARAFEEIGGEVVQTTSFVMRNSKTKDYISTFSRLVDFNSQDEKEKEFLTRNHLHTAQQENFSKIPGRPIAYWVSDDLRSKFIEKPLSSYGDTRRGLQTGESPRFIRCWFEISTTKLCFPDKKDDTKKWFLFNSGGSFRKWYGNIVDVVNWENNGSEIKSTGKAIIPSEKRYFDSLVNWNKVSSGKFSVRFQPENIIPGDASPFFHTSNQDTSISIYAMSVMNSKVISSIMEILGATINFEVGNIAKIPIIISEPHKPQIDQLVEQNISLSKTDWDSFETSWDFEGNPLI